MKKENIKGKGQENQNKI